MTELSPLAFSVYRSTMPFSIANFESVQSDSRVSRLVQVQAMLPKVGASTF